jgi:hypothetical protein
MARGSRAPASFTTTLFRYPGPGGWMFARVPDRHAPPATHAWGRTPVTASVDGRTWPTSVWRDKKHGTLLPVPKKTLGEKQAGDAVTVILTPRDP